MVLTNFGIVDFPFGASPQQYKSPCKLNAKQNLLQLMSYIHTPCKF